jgi:hypothetical protein
VNRFVLQAYLMQAANEARKHETVTRIRPETTMTPEENRPAGTSQTRRSVRLPVPDVDARPEPSTAPQVRRVPVPPRAALKDRLLRVAELAVGDWAPTLREALLRVLLFAVVLVALGIAFGAGVAVAGAAVGFVMFLVGRRRAGSAS